ncbi:hypothetical protein ACFVUQ_21710 [Streptomyces cyaneofuscatus]|uniref:hypothetical protein n=1 Tax=Streptomyces cyaneofuscatus TaxID=66883 RepID=UPI0036DB2EB4
MNLILLFAVTAIIGVPTATVWLLGRRAKVPQLDADRLLAGWLADRVGWMSSFTARSAVPVF